MAKIFWRCDKCGLSEEVKPGEFEHIGEKMSGHIGEHYADDILEAMGRGKRTGSGGRD